MIGIYRIAIALYSDCVQTSNIHIPGLAYSEISTVVVDIARVTITFICDCFQSNNVSLTVHSLRGFSYYCGRLSSELISLLAFGQVTFIFIVLSRYRLS